MTTQTADKNEWLARYVKEVSRCEFLEEQIQRMSSSAEGTTRRQGERCGQTAPNCEAMMKTVEIVVEMQEKLRERKSRCGAIYWEITEAIGQVDDEEAREVLMRRYLQGQSVQQISDEMALVPRRVYQLQRKGLNHITI